jgi:putative oxidoreductase
MPLRKLTAYRDFGLLILRFGIGTMFIFHGLPKIMGGPEKWLTVGSKMSLIGVSFFPEFWGFMAGFAEFVGGFLLILGFFFRPALLMMIFTMVIATMHHLASGDAFSRWSHSAEMGILFVALLLIGPGRFSLDEPGKL